MIRALALSAIVATLCACGQKGPLRLPDAPNAPAPAPNAPVVPTPPAGTPSTP